MGDLYIPEPTEAIWECVVDQGDEYSPPSVLAVRADGAVEFNVGWTGFVVRLSAEERFAMSRAMAAVEQIAKSRIEREAEHERRRRAAPQRPTRKASPWHPVLLADPCAYCGAPSEHVDHIEPLSREGADSDENKTGACARCNRSKQAKPLLAFLLDRSGA